MAKKSLVLIRVSLPPGEARLHMLDREQFEVGRDPESDIVLASPTASRKQLSVEIKGDEILVTDLGSRNGSYINGEPMEAGKKYPVTSQTSILLGKHNESVSFELMEMPTEFGDYKAYLEKFNVILSDMTLKESIAGKKAHEVIVAAEKQAAQIIEEAKEKAAAQESVLQGLKAEIEQEAKQNAQNTIRAAEEEITRLKKDEQVEIDALLERKETLLAELKELKRETNEVTVAVAVAAAAPIQAQQAQEELPQEAPKAEEASEKPKINWAEVFSFYKNKYFLRGLSLAVLAVFALLLKDTAHIQQLQAVVLENQPAAQPNVESIDQAADEPAAVEAASDYRAPVVASAALPRDRNIPKIINTSPKKVNKRSK